VSDTVSLFGSQVKKGYVIAGGLVVVAAVGYGWWRNRQAAAAGPAAADGSDTGAGDTSADDTGDDDELDALEGELEDGGDGYGSLYGYDGDYPLGTTTGTPGSYTSNAQWAQAAEASMGSDGSDAIAAALGKYITGQPATAAQQQYIEEAIAAQGYPPVAGDGGYPPSIRRQAGTTATKPEHAPAGLHSAPRTTTATVKWDAVTGAASYRLVAWKAVKGTPVIFNGDVTATSYTFRALTAGTQYGWHVAATDSAGTGPASPDQHFTTTRKAKR
jgi:hypothetical protein